MKHTLVLTYSNKEKPSSSRQDTSADAPGIVGEERLPENQIVQNFLDLSGTATVSKLTSNKEALWYLVKQDQQDMCDKVDPSSAKYFRPSLYWSTGTGATSRTRTYCTFELNQCTQNGGRLYLDLPLSKSHDS